MIDASPPAALRITRGVIEASIISSTSTAPLAGLQPARLDKVHSVHLSTKRG